MRRLRFASFPLALWIGLSLLALLVCSALFAPLLATHDPNYVPAGGQRLAPSTDHWFGTDQVGRDVFARVVYGARTSLIVGIATAALSGALGIVVGLIGGWRGGRTDSWLMRITEIFLVIPGLLFAAALIVVLGRNLASIVLVLAIAGWPVIARVTRSEVLRVKHEGFIEAAHISGSSPIRIMRVHVLPHLLPAVAAIVVTSIGLAILAEASLSFLGIGVVEPRASWGTMISSARNFLSVSPHLILFPSAAIFLTVLAFVLTGSALRSVLGLEQR